MKFAIYHRMREWAHEMCDPKLAEIEAPTKEKAERVSAHLGTTGTCAVPIPLTKALTKRQRRAPTLAGMR